MTESDDGECGDHSDPEPEVLEVETNTGRCRTTDSGWDVKCKNYGETVFTRLLPPKTVECDYELDPEDAPSYEGFCWQRVTWECPVCGSVNKHRQKERRTRPNIYVPSASYYNTNPRHSGGTVNRPNPQNTSQSEFQI